MHTRTILSAALLALPVFAQGPQTIASYPLATDLFDETGNFGPVVRFGNTSAAADGVCVGGTYGPTSAPGDEVRTPNLFTLDTDDFQIDVDFKIAPTMSGGGSRVPVVIGGISSRWIGLEVYKTTRQLVLVSNNSPANILPTTVDLDVWHWATLKYENGDLELLLDGVSQGVVTVGPLNTSNQRHFTTTNYSSGSALDGCIRNLEISNDTTIGVANARTAQYGLGCGGLSLSASGAPSIGNAAFALDIASPVALTGPAFIAFGRDALDPGVSLLPYGFTGCRAYTNLDVGFSAGVNLTPGSNTGSLAVPVPQVPALSGQLLTAQAIGFQPTQPATSNGVRVYFGM